MKRHQAALAIAVAATCAAPAHAQESVDWEMVTRIRLEGLRHSEVMDTLRHLTDEIGPRLTGSPSMHEANAWTQRQLESWGLQNSHIEPWGPSGRGWSFSRTAVHLIAPRPMPLSALPAAWSPGTRGAVRGPVFYVKLETAEDLDASKGRLAGLILLLDEARPLGPGDEAPIQRDSAEDLRDIETYAIPGPDQQNRRARYRERWMKTQRLRAYLVEENVAATIAISSRDAGVVRVTHAGGGPDDDKPSVPAIVMAAEHYNQLFRLVEGQLPPGDASAAPESPVEVEIEVEARFHDDATTANTIAEIPGHEGGAGVVMVGAHLDSWHAGTGSNDNAAGCAVAMEAVRILQALGVRPRRTIRIALWSGEEQGLLGSSAYVAEHFATQELNESEEQRALPARLRDRVGRPAPKPDHAGLSAYFNVDNGSGRIRGIYAQENAGVVPIFEAWLRPFHDLGADTVTMRNTHSTDHIPFDAVGLPGFQFIQDDLDYTSRTHHTHLDVYDYAHREDLMQASVVMASFLYHAAIRDERLPRKPIPEPSR